MGFWIFMFVMDIMIPFIMIAFGRWFRKSAPKEINPVFGYRTAMSMKNKDTWDYAHKYCGKLWYRCGLVMLPLSAAGMFLTLGENENTVGAVGGIICTVQVLLLIGSIWPVEIALKKNFDKDGKRRHE